MAKKSSKRVARGRNGPQSRQQSQSNQTRRGSEQEKERPMQKQGTSRENGEHEDDNHHHHREQDATQIQSFIPPYLQHVVFPCQGDFCQTPLFHPLLVVQLMAEGFLPMAANAKVLLPKLHQHRCVIRDIHTELQIHKSVRKKAKRFSLAVNTDLEGVMQGCLDQHGHNCWLYPPLQQAFRYIFSNEVSAVLMDGSLSPVRLYSIELYKKEDTQGNHQNNNDHHPILVGGELGYSVGSVYTSLTGFAGQDSAGSVQLAALGRLLDQSGFEMWDMGMDMPYKRDLGAQLLPRSQFVDFVHRVRVSRGNLRLLPTTADNPSVNARELIDRCQPTQQPQADTTGSHPVPELDSSSPHKDKKARSLHPSNATQQISAVNATPPQLAVTRSTESR